MSSEELDSTLKRSNLQKQTKAIVSAAALTLLLQIIGLVLQFGSQVIAAKLCGSDSQFGIYGQSRSWIQLLATIAAWGLPTVALRYIPNYVHDSQYESVSGFLRFATKKIILYSAFASVLTSIFLIAFRGPDPGTWVLIFGLIGVPFCATHLLQMQVTRSFEKIVWTQAPYNLGQPLLFLGFILIVWTFPIQIGSGWLVLCFIASLLGTSLLQSLPIWQAMPRGSCHHPASQDTASQDTASQDTASQDTASKAQITEWNSLANQLGISTSAALVLRESDVILVGLLAGDAPAGIYMAASRIARVCSFALNASGSIVGPRISNYFRKGKTAELEHLIQIATILSTIATVAIGIGLALFSSHLLALFGPGFEKGADLVVVLLVGHMVNAATGPSAQVLSLTGNQKVCSRVYLVSAVLHLIGNVIGILLWSAIGGAVATSFVLAICNLTMAFLVYRLLGISIFPRLGIFSRLK